MKSRSRYALFLIVFGLLISKVSANTIFITAEYITAYKPLYLLLSTPDGHEILTHEVKRKDYRKGVNLSGESTMGQEMVLTAITNGKGGDVFYNWCYAGISDGYVLDYQPREPGFFRGFKTASLKVYNYQTFWEVEWPEGTRRRTDEEGEEFLQFRFYKQPMAAVYLELEESASDQKIYYLGTAPLNDQPINGTDFKPLAGRHTVYFKGASIERASFEIYTSATELPFVLSRKVVDGKLTLPILSDVVVTKVNIEYFDNEYSEQGQRRWYYTSHEQYPDTLVATPIERTISDLNLQASSFSFSTAHLDTVVYELSLFATVNKRPVAFWNVLLEAADTTTFAFPILPNKLLLDYPLLKDSTWNPTSFCYKFFEFADPLRVQDISEAQLLNSDQWLVKQRAMKTDIYYPGKPSLD
ncbi:MAG: hypothetical protein AAGJ82_07005 [Bacteroidota bacterium]